MADEVKAFFLENQSLYWTIQGLDLRYLVSADNTTWLDPAPTNEQFLTATRSIPEVEPGTYVASFPAIPEGKYIVRLWQQTHATRAQGDAKLAADIMNWDGTKEVPFIKVGDGPYLVVITVKNQYGIALHDALVRCSRFGANLEARTDENGQAVFGLEGGTWTVVAAKFGHSHSGQPVEVTADATVDVAMDQQYVSPADDPAKCRVWTIAKDSTGEPLPNERFEFNMVKSPDENDDSFSFRNIRRETDANGYVYLDVPRLSRFEYRWGRGPWRRFNVPDAPTFKMPEVNDGR